MQKLLPPAGLNQAVGAAGINNATQIVGFTDLTNSSDAYIWDITHGVRYLNDATQFTIINGAGWTFSYAMAINYYGQIVGIATNPAGVPRVFLLTPQ